MLGWRGCHPKNVSLYLSNKSETYLIDIVTVLEFSKNKDKKYIIMINNDKKKINRSDIPSGLSGRWGYALLETEGWTTIPNILLMHQKELDLTNSEMMMLIHIISFIHYGDTPAFPSIDTLAKRVNQHSRTVQRTINKLLKKKLLKRKIRSKSINDKGLSNIYSIEPLIEKLSTINTTKSIAPTFISTDNDFELNQLLIQINEEQTEINRTLLKRMGEELKLKIGSRYLRRSEFYEYVETQIKEFQ